MRIADDAGWWAQSWLIKVHERVGHQTDCIGPYDEAWAGGEAAEIGAQASRHSGNGVR